MTQNSKHYAVVTELGKHLLRDAYEQHRSLNLTQMSLGDSNGAYVAPDVRFDSLVNELGQEALHEGTVHEHFIHAIVYVSRSRFAGKHIREFGLRDEYGNLIVYAAYPETLVSDEATSQFIQLEIECMVELENTEMVSLTITPIYPHATESEAGIARIATNEQVNEGENDSSFLTIKKLVHSLSVPHIIDKLIKNIWLPLAELIYPVGCPIPYPGTEAPDGYIAYIGQPFDKSVFVKLAIRYPTGVMPDLRKSYIRGLSDGETVLSFKSQSVQPLGFRGDPHNHDYSVAGRHIAFAGTYMNALTTNYNAKTSTVTVTGRITGTGDETNPNSHRFLFITRAA